MIKFKDFFKQYYCYLTFDDLNCDLKFHNTIGKNIKNYWTYKEDGKRQGVNCPKLDEDLINYFQITFNKNNLSCDKYKIRTEANFKYANNESTITLTFIVIFLGNKIQIDKITNHYGIEDRCLPYDENKFIKSLDDLRLNDYLLRKGEQMTPGKFLESKYKSVIDGLGNIYTTKA